MQTQNQYNQFWFSGTLAKKDIFSNWKDKFRTLNLPAIISPLHSKEPSSKKNHFLAPHYHIIARFPEPNLPKAKATFDRFNVKNCSCPSSVGDTLRSFCGVQDPFQQTQNENIFQKQPTSPTYPIEKIYEFHNASYQFLACIPTIINEPFTQQIPEDNQIKINLLITIINSYQFLNPTIFEKFLSEPSTCFDSNWYPFYLENKFYFDSYINKKSENYRLGFFLNEPSFRINFQKTLP